MGILSGQAADVAEQVSEEAICRRAINILKEIFSGSVSQKLVNRTKLKSFKVTKWKQNPFIKGAYSYMKAGSSGDGMYYYI